MPRKTFGESTWPQTFLTFQEANILKGAVKEAIPSLSSEYDKKMAWELYSALDLVRDDVDYTPHRGKQISLPPRAMEMLQILLNRYHMGPRFDYK